MSEMYASKHGWHFSTYLRGRKTFLSPQPPHRELSHIELLLSNSNSCPCSRQPFCHLWLSPNKCLIRFPLASHRNFECSTLVEAVVHRAPQCVCWVVYEIFSRMVVNVVTAAWVMKRANSKLQSEDSCSVQYKTGRWRWIHVLSYIWRPENSGLNQQQQQKKSHLSQRHSKLILNACFFFYWPHAPFHICIPWRNAVTVLRFKGVDLAVLWCSH